MNHLESPFAHMAATCSGFTPAGGRPNLPGLRRWLTEAVITAAAAFRGVNRHGKISHRRLYKDCVGWILERAARHAGFKPEPLGGHSLRAGHITQAAMNGVSERDIMRQTGHRSPSMLAKYNRIGGIFTLNAAAGLGIEPLRKRAYQRLNLAAESGFETLCFRADHRSKGIRRIRVQRITGNYRETEAGREFSPASFTSKDPETRPEMRAWL